MIFALDTSILIDLERKEKNVMHKFGAFMQTSSGLVCIPFPTYMEYYFGLLGKDPKNFEPHYAFLKEFFLLLPTQETAELLAHMKKETEEKGIILSMTDLLIAAQVKEHNLLLLTKDKDFKQLEGIRCEIL